MSPYPLKTWEWGPWKGVRRSWQGDLPTPDFVFNTENMVFEDPIYGGAIFRRPSDERGITGATGDVQLLHIFKRLSGPLTVMIQAGQIYTYNHSTLTWTLVVTTANLTTAGITLTSSGDCYAADFGPVLVINDGTNQPFTWNGASGAGGLTLLTNAPTKCFGRPCVYYGKVFFIKDVAASSADRATLVWSEENAANTGYEAGGFNNAWDLRQTDPGPLVCLVATNAALYYFREYSAGVVQGAVTPDFTAAGVHDNVSTTEGTRSPRGAVYADGWVWFINAAGRMLRTTLGQPLEYLSDQIPDAVDSALAPESLSAKAIVQPIPHYNAVAFIRASTPITVDRFADGAHVFSTLTGVALGHWDWATANGANAVYQTQFGLGWDTTSATYLLLVGCIEGASTRVTYAVPAVSVATYDVNAWDVKSWSIQFLPAGRETVGLWRMDSFGIMARLGTIGATGTRDLGAKVTFDSPTQTSTLADITSIPTDAERWIEWGLAREVGWLRPQVYWPSTSGLEDWGVLRAQVRGFKLPRFVGKT